MASGRERSATTCSPSCKTKASENAGPVRAPRPGRHTPPLRERDDDIIALAELFLGRVCRDYGLEEHAHNISHMAQRLGISRDKLRARLRELGLYSRS